MTSPKPAPEVASVGVRGLAAFATTHWSLIVRAADSGTAEGRAALEELCRTYWHPLYAFARRRGAAPADAEDLTQGFLADLLARGAVAKADANRGRFRTFLLAAFANYCSHERAKAAAVKRGGGQRPVSYEDLQAAEARLGAEPVSNESPERLYDRRWAARLIELALATVRHEYEKAGRAALFDALKPALLGEGGGIGYAGIGLRLGMTEGAVKIAALRLRQSFAGHFRAEVAKTVADPAEVEAEIRHLLAAVSA